LGTVPFIILNHFSSNYSGGIYIKKKMKMNRVSIILTEEQVKTLMGSVINETKNQKQ